MPRRTPRATEDERRFVRRDVRSADPSLSEQTNRRLTRELREAIGDDKVSVPADTPHPSASAHSRHGKSLAAVVSTSLLVVITLAAVLTVGAAVSLATGSWWAVVIASGVHAIGTIAVLLLSLDLTARAEHVSPSTAARLEEEGVGESDRMFSDMVDEYRGGGPPRHARRLTDGQEQPRLAWRSLLFLGASVVTAAAVGTIVAGLLLGWL